MAAKSGVCTHNGRTVIVPDAVPAGTVGLYSFNEFIKGVIVDRSGNGNHGIAGPRSSSFLLADEDSMGLSSNNLGNGHAGALGASALRSKKVKTYADAQEQSLHSPALAPALPSAPDRAGGVASAHFTGKSYYRIPPSASIAAMNKSFTAHLWLQLGDGTVASAAGACPFFALGDTVLYLTSSRHINLAFPGAAVTTSSARVRAHVWTHVTLGFSATSGEFSLFVNGVPDLSVKGTLSLDATSPVFIGAIPRSDCTTLSLFVDDVKLTARPPSPARVAAEAAVALGSVTPAFVQVGCARNSPCGFEDAAKACLVGYRLCSDRELTASGAYKVARQQGWVEWSDPLWTSDSARLRTDLEREARAAAPGDAAAAEALKAKSKRVTAVLEEAKAALCCLAQ
jgi:hypothetical protein